ncbi:hypothetical protein SEA_KOKO_80 [Mycobacterium phage Koko]|uniref:Uncharacterized protein n=5 Tax=Gladiatorvirus TaxID=2948726 RepID=A0A1C9LYX4_9CAUD|nr:hypothetical protein X820_gp036 [Mycobacterium phage CloudWang3]YP_008858502.1 hypothetical protein X828_gp036 [Mycobacterium phage Artemis2UCLA]YP_008859186.1 hypothetical protein X821_gp034 [Mycobacterium phage Zaka]YP_009014568.1 hypothetical protein CL99_gp035 [Mycobacterium phage Blue7]YP_010061402.1 hypothetical protein KIP56_gp034 [Mycobacterium phage Koko]ANT42266.1 hypothetical protein SEA_TONETONE_76 [Mycobacterium phage ToneTone]AOQ28092.1 hypothetical protein SEA_GRUUNAGA_78 [M
MYVDDVEDIEELEQLLDEAKDRFAEEPNNEQAAFDIEDLEQRLEQARDIT